MEHNYDNLHLLGTRSEMREMAHNRAKIKHSPIPRLSSLVSGLMTIMIGTVVLSAVTNNLKREGLM